MSFSSMVKTASTAVKDTSKLGETAETVGKVADTASTAASFLPALTGGDPTADASQPQSVQPTALNLSANIDGDDGDDGDDGGAA